MNLWDTRKLSADPETSHEPGVLPFTMKSLLVAILCQLSFWMPAQGKDIDTGRLWSRDAYKDGKLSKDELGDKLWKRMSAQDANGVGVW